MGVLLGGGENAETLTRLGTQALQSCRRGKEKD